MAQNRDDRKSSATAQCPGRLFHKTPVVDTFNAYPHLLHLGLKERFPFAVINVAVTAIGGENSESGAARFERDVLNRKPDVITIDYALNDRRHRIGTRTRGVGVDDRKSNGGWNQSYAAHPDGGHRREGVRPE